MSARWPDGYRLESLRRDHPRKRFRCGEPAVDDWLATKALQNQEKHLSVTKVLLDEAGAIAGYYTLASGQVDFGDLPAESDRRLWPSLDQVKAWLPPGYYARVHQDVLIAVPQAARGLVDEHIGRPGLSVLVLTSNDYVHVLPAFA